MNSLSSKQLQTLIGGLTSAQNPSEVVVSWMQSVPSDAMLMAMICLKEYSHITVPVGLANLPPDVKNQLISYFINENIYFTDHSLIRNTFSNGKVQFKVDYSVMFDTNFASFIDLVVRGKDLGANHNKIINILDNMIYYNINFDHIFYMIENTKQTTKIIMKLMNYTNSYNRLVLWKQLNKNFRWNLVSLELFKGIDCE